MVEQAWVEGAVRTGSGRSRRIFFRYRRLHVAHIQRQCGLSSSLAFFVVVVEMDFPRALRQGASKPGQ